MKNNPIVQSLVQVLLVGLYVLAVSALMTHIQNIIPDDKSILVPMAMLLLLVVSAAITGTLIVGRPLAMYLDGKKNEALLFFGYTIGWMFALIVSVFLVLVATK